MALLLLIVFLWVQQAPPCPFHCMLSPHQVQSSSLKYWSEFWYHYPNLEGDSRRDRLPILWRTGATKLMGMSIKEGIRFLKGYFFRSISAWVPWYFPSLWQFLCVLPFCFDCGAWSHICKGSTHFKDKSTDRMSAENSRLSFHSLIFLQWLHCQILSMPVVLEWLCSVGGEIRRLLMRQNLCDGLVFRWVAESTRGTSLGSYHPGTSWGHEVSSKLREHATLFWTKCISITIKIHKPDERRISNNNYSHSEDPIFSIFHFF